MPKAALAGKNYLPTSAQGDICWEVPSDLVINHIVTPSDHTCRGIS